MTFSTLELLLVLENTFFTIAFSSSAILRKSCKIFSFFRVKGKLSQVIKPGHQSGLNMSNPCLSRLSFIEFFIQNFFYLERKLT